jgi:hypothetical protein
MVTALGAEKLAELAELDRIIKLATDVNVDLFAALEVPHHLVSRIAQIFAQLRFNQGMFDANLIVSIAQRKSALSSSSSRRL